MAYALSDLINFVLSDLNEDSNSGIAALPSGSGTNGITLTSTAEITRLLCDAKNDVCRTALLARVNGTLAVTSGQGPLFPLSGFTFSGEELFRAAYLVTWTPTSGSPAMLVEMGWEAFFDFFPTSAAVPASGLPSYWAYAQEGLGSIQLDVQPSVNGTLTVTGYGIPPDMVGTSGELAWLPPDRYRVLVSYACAMICRKRVDDPDNSARFVALCREYDSIRTLMRQEIDPGFAQRFLLPFVPLSPPIGSPAPINGGDSGGGEDGG